MRKHGSLITISLVLAIIGSVACRSQESAEQQKKVDELRRQMVKSRADTHNKVMAVLTAEQRKQVREYGPWWATEEE